MTPTINAEHYGNLLLQYQPKIIKTEAENETFLAVVEALMAKSRLTVEEELLLELFVKLIEDFEAQHYSLNVSTPQSLLLHLMEAREIEVADLAEVLGERAERIAAGKERIGWDQAVALGQFFRVKPVLFLGN